jgi:hypothetical protein
MLYDSKGILRYSIVDIGYRLIVEVDQGISEYYRSLIPKYKDVRGQRYRAHISVVRKEVPPRLENWGKYNGEEVEFCYNSCVRWGTVYYWLDAYSKRLEEIRVELGLPISSEYTRPPDSFEKVFHITIGNRKEL